MILSKKVSIADPTYRALARIKAELTALRGRQVTYTEVIDELLEHWEATSAMVRDAKAGGQ